MLFALQQMGQFGRNLGERLSGEIFARGADQPLGRGVDQQDAVVRIDRDDGGGYPAEHRFDEAAPCLQLFVGADKRARLALQLRSEEHTSELQSLIRISYAVFCLKKKQE